MRLGKAVPRLTALSLPGVKLFVPAAQDPDAHDSHFTALLSQLMWAGGWHLQKHDVQDASALPPAQRRIPQLSAKSWTFVSAFTVLCGARTDLPDRHVCCVFWLNIAAALIQILTAIVMVGWIMSIFWGMDMVILANVRTEAASAGDEAPNMGCSRVTVCVKVLPRKRGGFLGAMVLEGVHSEANEKPQSKPEDPDNTPHVSILGSS
ncbi:Protein stum [Galemys pyrenaicus]|uniref:Protein stum n=1 Tax=Galemys pyrenaicus TaxID=202257 RepID=A0A8J6DKS7_GALPY|nr:Protein stum [Galemys pyrenaicus]